MTGVQTCALPIFDLPQDTKIQVWDSNSEIRCMVLPLPPEGAGQMTEDELTALVTREGLIGTAVR